MKICKSWNVGAKGNGMSAYKWLSRLSKLMWWFESKRFELPKTAWLSPYIFSISRRAN